MKFIFSIFSISLLILSSCTPGYNLFPLPTDDSDITNIPRSEYPEREVIDPHKLESNRTNRFNTTPFLDNKDKEVSNEKSSNTSLVDATIVPGDPLKVVLKGEYSKLGYISIAKPDSAGNPTNVPYPKGTLVKLLDPEDSSKEIQFKIP